MTPTTRRSTVRDIRRARLRITAVATLLLLVVLAVAGWAVIELFERESVRQLDDQLLEAAGYVARTTASGERLPTGASEGAVDNLVQVIDDEGDVVFAGRPLDGEAPLWSPGDAVMEPSTASTDTHGDLRVVAVEYRDRWLVLAESLDVVAENQRSLREAMLLSLPALALVLAALVWLVVGRALRPVAAGLEREERLVADVGHELRSPLAGVRVLLETEPADPAERNRNRAAVLATLQRLEVIADRLLLATADDTDRARHARPVDLDEIVSRQVRMLAARTQVQVDTAGVSVGQVIGREDELESMIENLLTNAVRHARHLVRITLREADGTVVLTVDDDGPGISRADRDRVFERFTRLDTARSRDQGGSGLGLAIVRTIVDAHAGSIAIEDAPEGGARFVVRLPSAEHTG